MIIKAYRLEGFHEHALNGHNVSICMYQKCMFVALLQITAAKECQNNGVLCRHLALIVHLIM